MAQKKSRYTSYFVVLAGMALAQHEDQGLAAEQQLSCNSSRIFAPKLHSLDENHTLAALSSSS